MYAGRYAHILHPMNDNSDHAKLDALVGAALKGLVESGASAEAIGAFAASYRIQAAQVLGLAAAPPEEPDLLELVTEAVTKVMGDLNLTPRKVRRKSRRVFVSIGGNRTSVMITSPTMERLEKERGAKEAVDLIKQMANIAPVDVKNRSKWVEDKIFATIFAPENNGVSSNARH